MFKIGDVVKRTSSCNGGMNVGDIGIITDTHNRGNVTFYVINGQKHNPKYLELVVKSKPNFQVGDEVVCVLYGEGVIDYIEEGFSEYPIAVVFDGYRYNQTYTMEGNYYDDAVNQTLFHADGYQAPVGGKEPERKPMFEHDEVIMVHINGGWIPLHFKEWSGNTALCYREGKSSKTGNSYVGYSSYKKYEE